MDTEKRLRGWMLFWCLFIGVGALAGGLGMLLDPSGRALGMDAMLPYFQVLPLAEHLFQNFVFPGIALLLVNGFTQLFTAWQIARKRRRAPFLSALCGVILMLWILIQFYIFPLNFLSTLYFIFGAVEALLGMLWMRARRTA